MPSLFCYGSHYSPLRDTIVRGIAPIDFIFTIIQFGQIGVGEQSKFSLAKDVESCTSPWHEIPLHVVDLFPKEVCPIRRFTTHIEVAGPCPSDNNLPLRINL